jgi:beta-mannosidase
MRTKQICLVLFVALLACARASSAPQILDLGGNDWVAVNSNGSIVVKNCVVPGNIVTDLQAAQVIDDPYWRFNDIEYRWIALDNWRYEKVFDYPLPLVGQQIVLEFDGLDTVANVTLNGALLGTADNMFRQWRYDVTTLLRAKNNRLVVAFQSAISYVQQQAVRYPYYLPSADDSVQNGELLRNYVRKEQCSFSWDWGPGYMQQGIWRPVRLVSQNSCRIRAVAPMISPNSAAQAYHLTAHVELECTAIDTVALLVSVAGSQARVIGQVSRGVTLLTAELDVTGVNEWWPQGYGDQVLYNLTAAVTTSDKLTLIDTRRVGFRTVELIEQPYTDQPGLSFYFKINGVALFVKGANWIPADSFENRVTGAVLDRLLESTVAANMNMLRVWGGGVYQPDEFYDKCDELGIMVWQELMFACAMYPRDPAYLRSAVIEVQEQITRLMHHVSIVTWSANNENEVALGWFPETLSNRDLYAADYYVLYIQHLLPAILSRDTSRQFLPSSPSNGGNLYYDLQDTEHVIVTHANNSAQLRYNDVDPYYYVMRWGNPSGNYGDVHWYNYVNDCTDLATYPHSRFVSEYGFQSFPSLITWRTVSDPALGDWKIDSEFLFKRQHHRNGTAQVLAQIKMHFNYQPVSDPEHNFGNFVYLSQATQALCMKTESELYRRSRTAQANTMGTIYWQLNSIWPAPTWSSLEYGGRWKMLHYFVKRFYSPVLVSPHQPQSDTLAVDLISDLTNTIQGTLKFELWSWKGAQLNSWSVPYSSAPLTASTVWSTSIKSMLAGYCRPETCMLYISCLDENGKQLSDNAFYFTKLRSALLVSPNVTVSQFTPVSSTSISFAVQSTAVAPYLWLETPLEGRFSDNGFVTLPGNPVQVTFYSWNSTVTALQLKSSLTVKSLYDSFTTF